MRLTSATIKQLIKEELQHLLQEKTSDLATEIAQHKSAIKKLASEGQQLLKQLDTCRGDTEGPVPPRCKQIDDKVEKNSQDMNAMSKRLLQLQRTKGSFSREQEGQRTKGSFSREQEGLRRKINQLKKAGKIDKATWRKARNALYKSPKAANAVLQKAGAAAKTKPQGPEGQRVASAGRPSATGAKKVERKPTAKDMETARHLRSALVKLAGANYKWGPMSLKEQKHPQFDRILQAVYQAAQKGHMAAKLALESLGVMKKDVQVAGAGRPVTGGDPEKAPEKKAAQKAWYEIQKECIDKCEEKYPATISTRQKKCVAVCKKQGSKNLRAQTKKQKAVQSTKVTKATQVPKVPAA